uniref:NADH-ubiquinone oxidoreductase chain 2 n=1 Tax=Bostrichoidea sp. 5 KM-2017 TaxID=2219279 RepID=A0A346RGQ3_9COLE|nr:NADH dehydrogenase subunit 2 [Bostrichoidea sp. 5 KM-2017]
MNTYKIMFMMMLMTGTLISISSYSWLGMWIGLEINLLSMIPLMSSIKSPFSTESSLKYFIIQALSSMILLLSIIASSYSNYLFMKPEILILMNSALMMKIGMAPFHFWFPEIIEGLSWMIAWTLMTWQKIAPMALMVINITSMNFINMMIISSITLGGILGINQTSMRKIMVYSSINHMGWMLAALMINEFLWWMYLIIYFIITFVMIFNFNEFNIKNINQASNMNKLNKQSKISFMLNFLSLAGLPPFLGFLPKWFTIKELIFNQFITTSIIAVVMTLITLYFYTRALFPSILMDKTQNKISTKYKKNYTINIINSINILSLPICSTIAFML